MPGSVILNEVRVQLLSINSLSVIKCSLSGISSKHKHHIVLALKKVENRVSIFEGEILFVLPVDQNFIEKEKNEVSNLLSTKYYKTSNMNCSIVSMKQVPERVIERLIFSMISFQVMKKGYFTVFGNCIFQPTRDPEKFAHNSVEITSTLEDGFLKFYFDPTFLALINISNSKRNKKEDIEVVSLCSYRTQKLCPFVSADCSCPYQIPGNLGYLVEVVDKNEILESQRLLVNEKFSGCPRFSDEACFIRVKYSKKGTNTDYFPSFMIASRFSIEDLIVKPDIRRLYRNATLMDSAKRLTLTNNWINEIFYQGLKDMSKWGKIKVNNIELPVENVLSTANIADAESSIGIYSTKYISEQKISNDSYNPTPLTQSGGWLFTNKGAFDRRDQNRPFDRISPYLIIPRREETVNKGRRLMEYFSSGTYKRKFDGDNDFLGINSRDNQVKYNTHFENPFTEEEGLFFVEDSLADFEQKAKDIVREWHTKSNQDPNKHVFAIIPGDEEADNNPYYYNLKRIFVEEGIPSTFISLNTLNKIDDKSIAFGPILESIWLNVYAKMGGKPWRLASQLGNVHCFIGIGFGINQAEIQKNIYAGVAHIFDNYGSWLDVASDSADISINDLDSFGSTEKYTQGSASFKISESVSKSIVYNALKLYQDKQTKTHENATNIVLHKLGQIYECEVIGFLEGIRQVLGTLGKCKLGLLQIEQEHHIRLYDQQEDIGKQNHVIYKGSSIKINKLKNVLATTGRMNKMTFSGLKTNYYGIGTPKPLLFTSIIPSESILRKYGCNNDQFYDIDTLTDHAMALTQLHWGSLRDSVRLPITALYAQKVADLISKTKMRVNPSLGYYRPWFL